MSEKKLPSTLSWSEDGSPPNFPLHDSFAHRRWWRSSNGCGPGSRLLCNISLLSSWAAMQWLWPRQLSFSLYRRVLQVKWPLKQLKYLRIFIVTKFLFVKKLAIYSCFFWLKRDNQVFECFSPFPFSSGHAGHHRKSEREAETKGKHINKVNIPRK